MTSADIAIVGLGPVGAVLANLLGRLGLRVDVFERDRTAYALPRAVHFDDEVMRVFQAVGLAGEIAAGTHVSPGTLFVDGEGARHARLVAAHGGGAARLARELPLPPADPGGRAARRARTVPRHPGPARP